MDTEVPLHYKFHFITVSDLLVYCEFIYKYIVEKICVSSWGCWLEIFFSCPCLILESG